MSREKSPSLHIEWAPGRVQAVDVASSRRVSGTSLESISSATRGHKDVLVGVSRSLVFLKTVPLPKAAPEDLRRILGVQVAQLFPLPADQLAFDFFQTPERTADGYLTVVAAIRADDLRQLRSEFQEAGLKPSRILPVALGAPAVAAHAGGKRDALVAEATGDSYTLDVVQGGVLRLSRTTPEGADLAREATRTLAAAGMGDLPRVMAGAANGGTTASAYDNSSSDSGAATATLPAPMTLVNAISERGTSLEMLHEAPDSFNFELAEDRVREAKQRVAAKSRLAAILMAAALLLVLTVYLEYSDAQKVVTRGQGQWTILLNKDKSIRTAELAKKEKAVALQQVLNSAFTTGQPVSDIVGVIGDAVPKSAWITALSVERGKPVQIRGTASDPDDVARLLRTLSDSGRFRNVQLVVANSGRISTTPVVQFSLTATAIGNLPMPVPTKKKTTAKPAASTSTSSAAGTGTSAK